MAKADTYDLSGISAAEGPDMVLLGYRDNDGEAEGQFTVLGFPVPDVANYVEQRGGNTFHINPGDDGDTYPIEVNDSGSTFWVDRAAPFSFQLSGPDAFNDYFDGMRFTVLQIGAGSVSIDPAPFDVDLNPTPATIHQPADRAAATRVQYSTVTARFNGAVWVLSGDLGAD